LIGNAIFLAQLRQPYIKILILSLFFYIILTKFIKILDPIALDANSRAMI